MRTEEMVIHAALQVQKPVHEVFEAIVDPARMANYFISDGSGRMEEGRELIWHFPEFPDDVPVRVGRIEKDRYISCYWDVDGREHMNEMQLEPYGDGSTVIRITERSISGTPDLNWLKGNTEGWANFLACLKAWLEYGVHLRQGAFDFRFAAS
ncbi:MAG: SRPBCC domain-containing protein [Bacteroidia bacterium]|nr:SRPBCC domain-containing protein [Bacteroidia bacterium]